MGVIRRLARVLVRLAGWLLTPIAATLTALVGATIAGVVAPAVSPVTGLVILAAGGLIGAILGYMLWVRLLRGAPQIREALAMTPEGGPRPDVVEELMTLEHRAPPAETPP